MEVHICVHCHLDPPDGSERPSAYNDEWLHPRCEKAFIDARMAEEGLLKDAPNEDDDPWLELGEGLPEEEPSSKGYRTAEPPASKPYAPIRNRLLRLGYRLASRFDYALPGGRVLYSEDRFELQGGIQPSDERPAKTCRFWHDVNGTAYSNTGPRDERIIYGWQAVIDAGPGATVHITEGARKAQALIAQGVLATAVAYHSWNERCINALCGCHIVYHEDHDLPDANGTRAAEKLSADARTKLAPVVASFRTLPAQRLWAKLERSGEPPHGWDIKDWLDAGGDATRLEEVYREIPADSAELGEWDAGDDTTLPPPRRWLTAGQFCRTFLSGLVAPGATGKTALRILQALALPTGKPLAGQHIYRRCRVLIVCFEDDAEELRRRVLAALLHYKISLADVKGWLFLACPKGLKLMEMRDGERAIGMLEPALRRVIERRRPDLVILDPFVKLHALEENDNAAMDAVADLLTQLGREYDIAMDSPAHTRKGMVAAGDADARRGASAARDAGRLDYTLIPMSEDEAKAFGIPPEERREYLRLDSAKVNLLPPARTAQWFKLISVPLGNTTPDYPDGDYVQTLEPWKPPEILAGFMAEAIEATLKEIDAGLPNGQRYSSGSAATGRAAWRVVQKHCPSKTEAQCREIIRLWLKTSVLREDDYDDPVDRKLRKGLRLNRAE